MGRGERERGGRLQVEKGGRVRRQRRRYGGDGQREGGRKKEEGRREGGGRGRVEGTLSSFFSLANLSRDKIVQQTIAEKINRIILSYSFDNAVKDNHGSDSAHFWKMELTEDGDLKILVNEENYDYSLYDFETKIDWHLRTRIPQGIFFFRSLP
jgi:hypothetical protein